MQNLDGFFVTRSSVRGAPLYYVSRCAKDNRIACLASDDNGQTWYDYAVSEEPHRPYAIGGCRELTGDGCIVGSFTEARSDGKGSGTMDPARVPFFRIQAGLCAATLRRFEYADGRAVLRFSDTCGDSLTY